MPTAPISDLSPGTRSLAVRAKDLYETALLRGSGEEGARGASGDGAVHCSSAPGRVNLIGEHTDYTGGYVLPLAIGYRTVCYGRGEIVKRGSPLAASRIVSAASVGDVVEFVAGPSLKPSTTDRWANYVQGVVMQYLPDLEDDETFALEVAIAGDVPLGSGLSSSASLEVATAAFLESVLERRKDNGAPPSAEEAAKERAVRCRRAENEFCGVPCGIMDQLVSSAGRRGRLLLIDCRSLDVREVSAGDGDDDDAPVIVVANSNVKHDLGEGEYPVRVQQCEEATAILSEASPDIKTLRDASMDHINAAASSGRLGGVLLRRARHVVSENRRTLDVAEALGRGDWDAAGRLMYESHASMRDDYEVSCDEVDALVELARRHDGVYGSRLTGGGFGGCTVTLARRNCARGLIARLEEGYEGRTGRRCDCFVTSPADGASAFRVAM